jgi:hypothetical protein
MKTLFKLSDFYFSLFAFILILASCHRKELSQTVVYDTKLERLSAELEESPSDHSFVSVASIEEEANIEEQNASSDIVKDLITKNINPGLPLTKKSDKEVKNIERKHELRPQDSGFKSKINRLTQRMKLGIILAAIGLVVMLVLSWTPLYLIGAVVFVIGVVLIIIELVNGA